MGEEFIHLLGGLRRVDEALRYTGLGEGDRLGHALALGIDVGQWCELTWVDVASESAHLRTLQRHLRGQVAGRGIVVDVNPSSNLLIGNLADLESHPFWRFSPPVKRDGAPPPVGVCIGSDDPLTFSTTLRHE